MSSYAIVLTKLEQTRCVVVGGGRVAERKIRELISAGARPIVISPTLTSQLTWWNERGDFEHWARQFEPGDLEGAQVIIAATNDPLVNARIARSAPAGALVNVVDAPRLGNFHTTATVRRGDLLLSVSTQGRSPALSAQVRRELAQHYGPEYKRIADVFGRWRELVNQRIPPPERQQFWQDVRSFLHVNPERNIDALMVDVLSDYHQNRHITTPVESEHI